MGMPLIQRLRFQKDVHMDRSVPFAFALFILISSLRAADTAPSPISASSLTASNTIVSLPPGPPASTIPSDSNFATNFVRQSFLEDHLALSNPGAIDLIFIGDSITEQWRWGSGRPVWQKFYAGRAVDFGVSADKTQHVLWRLERLGIKKLHPKVAVILIGTNNWTQENTPETIAAGVKAVVTKTRETFPGVKIVLVSILPNSRAKDKMAAANALIKTFADGDTVIWLDLASKFTPEGNNWKGLQKDKLHLTTAGYEMWAAELNPILDRIAPKAN